MNTLLEGRTWVVGDSVNTDSMYPGYAMKLPLEEAAKHVFYDLRPGWTEQVEPGDLIIAGRNFGVGSSRPVAKLLRILGIQAIIAEEFNSLFYRNCINYGLPALTVGGVRAQFSDGDTAQLEIAEGWLVNRRTGQRFDTPGLPTMLLEILEAGGLMPRLARAGYVSNTEG
jgi:3-isopropylmalate/(R)-2-methylmalate dehydratase small subunit